MHFTRLFVTKTKCYACEYNARIWRNCYWVHKELSLPFVRGLESVHLETNKEGGKDSKRILDPLFRVGVPRFFVRKLFFGLCD